MLYIFAIASGIAFALLGLNYKYAEQQKCRPLPFIVMFNAIAAAVTALQLFFASTQWDNPRMWLLSIALGALLFTAIRLLTFLNTIGPATISWTIVNLSLIVPIFLSQLIFHEKTSLIDLLLLIFFVLMLKLFESGSEAAGELAHGKRIIFIITISILFLVNGTYQFGVKIMQYKLPPNSEISTAIVLYATASLIALIFYLKKYGFASFQKKEVQAGFFAGLSSGAGLAFMMAAVSLPAMILFPISQGIALLGGITLTATIYHESLHPTKLLGFACGLIMLTIAIFREQIILLLTRIM